jgi:hypothetical protein
VGVIQLFGDGPLLLIAHIIVNFAQFKDIGSFLASAHFTTSGVGGGVQLSVTRGSGFEFTNASDGARS